MFNSLQPLLLPLLIFQTLAKPNFQLDLLNFELPMVSTVIAYHGIGIADYFHRNTRCVQIYLQDTISFGLLIVARLLRYGPRIRSIRT